MKKKTKNKSTLRVKKYTPEIKKSICLILFWQFYSLKVNKNDKFWLLHFYDINVNHSILKGITVYQLAVLLGAGKLRINF